MIRKCSTYQDSGLGRSQYLRRKELIEVENDEAQSRLKMKLAKDKLLVYGLTEKEIENASQEDGVQKAKMILRSRGNRSRGPASGGPGKLLHHRRQPDDHRASRPSLGTGNVSELDAEKVEVGQKLKVIVPLSDRTIDAKVNYIDKAIDADSRTVKFRTTIVQSWRPAQGGHVRAAGTRDRREPRQDRRTPRARGTAPECDGE